MQFPCREVAELYRKIVVSKQNFDSTFRISQKEKHKHPVSRESGHREMTELKKLLHDCSEKVAPFKIVEIGGVEMRAFESEAVIELMAEVTAQRKSANVRGRGSRRIGLDNLFQIVKTKEGKVVFIDLYLLHLTSIPQSIKKFVALEDLNLQSNQISEITNLDGLDFLQTLNLAENKLQSTVGLSTLKSLEHLVLSGNQITKIEQLDQLKKLKNLQLNKNRNLLSLSGLKNLTELEELEVCVTSVRSVFALRNSKKLKQLDLSSTRFSDLHELDGFENLEELNICSCALIPEKMTREKLAYWRAKLGNKLHK